MTGFRGHSPGAQTLAHLQFSVGQSLAFPLPLRSNRRVIPGHSPGVIRRPHRHHIRTRGRVALIRPDSSSDQISATSRATNAQAARLKEPPASLGGLLQSGGRTSASPRSTRHLTIGIHAPAFIAPDDLGQFRAHLPEPLTDPGAARACPAGLPSPSNQRTVSDQLGWSRPFNSFSRLPLVGLRAARIGDEYPSSCRGNRDVFDSLGSVKPCVFSAGLTRLPASESPAFSAPLGIWPLPSAIEHSDFPWKSRFRFFAARKGSVLRGSGPLRSAVAFELLNVIK